MYKHIIAKLDYLEIANQVLYKGLIHNIKLKLAI
jgi:hypothetical protein